MRRFLVCAILLAVLLLLARGVDSARADSGGRGEAQEFAMGSLTLDTRDPDRFFDHRTRTKRPSSWARSLRDAAFEKDGPARVGDRIRFRYRDRGYERVWIVGSFTRWRRVEMDLDERHDRWEVRLRVDPGEHQYRFLVELEDGRVRERTDRVNPRRSRDDDRGWVSELVVDRHGEVEPPRRSRDSRRRRDRDYDLDLVASMGLQYQRVDGWLLSAQPRFRSSEPWSPVLEGDVGYGFKSERWSARITFLQPLQPDQATRLVISGYDRTDFTDRTGVGDLENTLSTLVFREDNRDWYRREGFSVGIESEFSQWLLARLEMRADDYESMGRVIRAGWGGRDDFLPNPEIDEGFMRSLYLQLRFGTDLDHLWLSWERSDDDMLSTDFEFTQLTLQGRTRLRMGRDQYVDLRGRFSSGLDGTLPRQKRYLLGGIGTVRGYRYQSLLMEDGSGSALPYGGERLALFNAEYALGVDDDIHVALFFDSGMAYVDREADVDLKDWSSSVGLGIFTGDDDDEVDLRLDLIKALDDGDSDLMVQGRLKRMF